MRPPLAAPAKVSVFHNDNRVATAAAPPPPLQQRGKGGTLTSPRSPRAATTATRPTSTTTSGTASSRGSQITALRHVFFPPGVLSGVGKGSKAEGSGSGGGGGGGGAVEETKGGVGYGDTVRVTS